LHHILESVTLSPIWEGSVKSGALSPTLIFIEISLIFLNEKRAINIFPHKIKNAEVL